jgi:hypothetical protein
MLIIQAYWVNGLPQLLGRHAVINVQRVRTICFSFSIKLIVADSIYESNSQARKLKSALATSADFQQPDDVKLLRSTNSPKYLLPPLKFLAGRQLDAFVGAIINADALVLDNTLTEHLQEIVIVRQHINRLPCLGDGPGFHGAIANFSAADCAPHFMPAHACIEDLGNGIKGKLTGLGDHHIHNPHQVIGGVHSMISVIKQKYMQPFGRLTADVLGDRHGFIKGEVRLN